MSYSEIMFTAVFSVLGGILILFIIAFILSKLNQKPSNLNISQSESELKDSKIISPHSKSLYPSTQANYKPSVESEHYIQPVRRKINCSEYRFKFEVLNEKLQEF